MSAMALRMPPRRLRKDGKTTWLIMVGPHVLDHGVPWYTVLFRRALLFPRLFVFALGIVIDVQCLKDGIRACNVC